METSALNIYCKQRAFKSISVICYLKNCWFCFITCTHVPPAWRILQQQLNKQLVIAVLEDTQRLQPLQLDLSAFTVAESVLRTVSAVISMSTYDRTTDNYTSATSSSKSTDYYKQASKHLHSYLRRCLTASSTFCQSSSTTRLSTQSLQILWPSGFFCRGSGYLELPERRIAWTVVHIMRFINLLTYLLIDSNSFIYNFSLSNVLYGVICNF